MWTISRATADSLRHADGSIVDRNCATLGFINISWDMNYKDVYSRLNRNKSAQKTCK